MHILLRYTLLILGLVASQAIAQEREWSWDVTDDEAFLVFGTPNTDDVGISFWCKRASGKVKVFTSQPSKGADLPLKLTLQISGQVYQFKSTPSVDSNLGSIAAETEIPLTHAVFKALLEADYFTVSIGQHVTSVPLADANVATLIKECS